MAVLCVAALSLPLTTWVGFRAGGYALALATGLAALGRATLPERLCLGLLVRTRRSDVAVNLALALALLVGAHLVPS